MSLGGTTNIKELPRVGAVKPTEGMGFHHSHIDKKKAYGCQAAGMPICAMGGGFLCHGSRMCGKAKSKTEPAQELVSCLPDAGTVSCAVFDFWYASKDMITGFWAKGYGVARALGANRAICPAGHRIQIKELPKLAGKEECCLVAANSKKYYIHRLVAHLTGIANSAALISWPEGDFGNGKAMGAFLSPDASLGEQEIIGIYTQKWPIEVSFKECKNTFGAKKSCSGQYAA